MKDGNGNGFTILLSYIFIICKGRKAVDFSSARKRNLRHLRGRLKAGSEAERVKRTLQGMRICFCFRATSLSDFKMKPTSKKEKRKEEKKEGRKAGRYQAS